MTDKPIQMHGHDVRATLAGLKTEMRIPVADLPTDVVNVRLVGDRLKYGSYSASTEFGRIESPYGWIGDRMFVQEEWAHAQPAVDIVRADGRSYTEIADGFAIYRADGCETIEDARRLAMSEMGDSCREICIRDDRWMPANTMPREFSRLVLEITGLRAERLQAIDEDGALAEWVSPYPEDCAHPRRSCDDIGCLGPGYRAAFCDLWCSIYGPESWEANPWVWVYRFRRMTP